MALEREEAYRQRNAVKLLKIISEDYNQQIQNWAGVDYSKLRKQLNSHQELPKPRNTIIPYSTQRQNKLQTIFRKRSDKKSILPYQVCPNYCKQYKSFTFNNQENSSENYESQKKKQMPERKILKATTCSKLHAEQTISKISVGQEISSQLRTTGSQQYILKVTKFSIKSKKEQNLYLNEDENKCQEIEKIGNLTGRLTQKYKNRVKKKISHKFLLRKYQGRNSSVLKLNSQELLNKKFSQRVPQKVEQEKPLKSNLLRNWLESNRYRRRKSVACLLRELFEHKSQQKQVNPSKKTGAQSTRLLSLSPDNKMINY